MVSYKDEKLGGVAYASSPISQLEPHSAISKNSVPASLAEYERKDQIYKHRIRTLRLVSRLLSVILAAIITSTLAYTLSKYFLTRNHLLPGTTQHAWVTPATVWPTILLLCISTISLTLDSITVCTYICGVGAANKVSSFTSYVIYAMLGVKIVVWGAMAGIFKMEQTQRSLWGYSCSSYTDTIYTQVHSFVNFGKLCTMQTGAYWATILEAVVGTLSLITTLYMMKRASQKKKMAQLRQSLTQEETYGRQTEGV